MSCRPSTIAEFLAEYQAQGVSPGRLAVVSLGANLPSEHGAPAATLAVAAEQLALLSQWPVVLSPIMETEPLDCPPGSPLFANAVAVFDPGADQAPAQLLARLQDIETRIGRVRSGLRNEARVLDLDLIAFGDIRQNTALLTLPHPRASQRLFVLEPLAQIWPRYRIPGTTCDVSQLVKQTRSAS